MITAVLFLLISITTAIQADKACLEDPREDRLILRALLVALKLPIPGVETTPKEVNTSFLLFTRQTGVNYQTINTANVSAVTDSSFSPNRTTVFWIHGYNSEATAWATTACQKTLKVYDVNCICVDWKNGAKGNYLQAIFNMPVVGAAMACFITTLGELFGSYDGSRVRMFAHSLGAHAAGQGARMYTKRTNVMVRQIYAMDPAGPLMGENNDLTLKPTDAACVEAMYTDTGPFVTSLGSSGYGTHVVCGHRNIYPNGGKKQPGCPTNIINATIQNLKDIPACNHQRSYLLLIDTIETQMNFTAYRATDYEAFQNGTGFPCSNGSCTSVGYNGDSCSSSNERSFYYFNTGADSPYKRSRVKVQCSLRISVDTKGELDITFHHGSGETEKYQLYSGDLRNGTQVTFLDVEKETPPENVTVTCSTSDPSNVNIPQVTLQYGHNNQTSNYCAEDPEAGAASRTLHPCDKNATNVI